MIDTLISGINETHFTKNWQNENEVYVIQKF